MPVSRFAGILASQLISNAEYLSQSNCQTLFREEQPMFDLVFDESRTTPKTDLSSMTAADVESNGKVIVRQMKDCNDVEHFLVKYDMTTDLSGRRRAKARPCKQCRDSGRGRKDTIYYRISCGIKSSYCNDLNRDCFKEHIISIKRITRSSICDNRLCSSEVTRIGVERFFFQGCRQLFGCTLDYSTYFSSNQK
jgi:hypothetical protein